MPMRLCFDCKELVNSTQTTNGRCPDCARAKDRERGTRRMRGIGSNHERFAQWIKDTKAFCECFGQCGNLHVENEGICGQHWGDPDNPITVGHIRSRADALAQGLDPDDALNFRPECRACNLRKGPRP